MPFGGAWAVQVSCAYCTTTPITNQRCATPMVGLYSPRRQMIALVSFSPEHMLSKLRGLLLVTNMEISL